MPATTSVDYDSVLVEIKQNWSDSWSSVSSDVIEPINAARYVASAQLDFATIKTRYGRIRYASQGGPVSAVSPYDLVGHWLRLSLSGGLESVPIFTGQITNENRQPHGKMINNPASGYQWFTAYGGYQLLKKSEINESIWEVNGLRKSVDWLPPMNRRDSRNILVGNKGLNLFGDNLHCLHGSAVINPIWTSYDYLQYIIGEFLPTGSDHPEWTVGGHVEAILELEDAFDFGDVTNVAEVIHTIIPRRLGVDWAVTPTDSGFEITIFSLLDEDQTFGSTVLPANPNQFSIDAKSQPDIEVSLSKTKDQKFRKVRVVGNRIVVAGSFSRSDTSEQSQIEDGWTSDQQIDYQTGTGSGSDEAQLHDEYRMQDQHRSVFGRFVVTKDESKLSDNQFPSLNSNGQIDTTIRADSQNIVRSTLGWTPLIEGTNYSTEPPTNDNPDDVEPNFLPPAAYVRRAGTNRYVPCDKIGVGVASLPNEWGVLLSASPNHLIAEGKFVATQPTAVPAGYEFDDLKITIAWESDKRLTIEYEDETAPETDGAKIIELPDAELWYVSNGTITGISTSGSTLLCGGYTVRNDADRLARVMAGAIARYCRNRFRAIIEVKGLTGWHQYLGYMLSYINDGTGDSNDLKAIVTGVEWQFSAESPASTIRTGYAD